MLITLDPRARMKWDAYEPDPIRASLCPSGTTQRLWMSITGSSSISRLKDIAVVRDVHGLAPVGRRAPGGCERRRLEWFAEMGQDLPNRPWLWCNAISRMSPPHAGQGSGNSSPTRAMSLAHAIRDVSCERGFWFVS